MNSRSLITLESKNQVNIQNGFNWSTDGGNGERKCNFLSDLLDVHRTFKSASSLLPRTRLSVAYERSTGGCKLDESIQIIMSLLSDRVYQIYLENTMDIHELYNKVKSLLAASGVRRPTPLIGREQATLAEVWDGLLEGIPRCVKRLVSMGRELPGINELNTKDFTTIVNTHLFNFYLLSYSMLYIDEENYNLLFNKIQYTRNWMLKVIGEEMVNALFEWTKKFNDLCLTYREIALLFPFLLTTPGLFHNNTFLAQ